MAINAKTKRGDSYGDETAHMPSNDGLSRLIVERREIIADIELNYNGGQPPIHAGFEAMANYMVENLVKDSNVSLEFTYGTHTFRATAEPARY